MVAKNNAAPEMSTTIVKRAQRLTEDGDETQMPFKERLSAPPQAHITGRLEEGSSRSSTGPQSQRRRRHKWRPPELGCHCCVFWEEDIEVPSRLGEVRVQRRAGAVASESGGILKTPDSR